MKSLKRSSKHSSKPFGNCKKHPKHKQSPGVCSLCLQKKLSKLPTSNSRATYTTTVSSCSSSYISSLSSYYSSSSASSCSSPLHGYCFTRDGSKGSKCLFFTRSNNMIQKSKSLAFVFRMTSNYKKSSCDEKKKYGFWSKFILRRPSSTRRLEGTLLHSRTIREMVH